MLKSSNNLFINLNTEKNIDDCEHFYGAVNWYSQPIYRWRYWHANLLHVYWWSTFSAYKPFWGPEAEEEDPCNLGLTADLETKPLDCNNNPILLSDRCRWDDNLVHPRSYLVMLRSSQWTLRSEMTKKVSIMSHNYQVIYHLLNLYLMHLIFLQNIFIDVWTLQLVQYGYVNFTVCKNKL